MDDHPHAPSSPAGPDFDIQSRGQNASPLQHWNTPLGPTTVPPPGVMTPPFHQMQGPMGGPPYAHAPGSQVGHESFPAHGLLRHPSMDGRQPAGPGLQAHAGERPVSEDAGDLERRLRNMILKNAGHAVPEATSATPSKADGPSPPVSLPPHMRMASQADQNAYLAQNRPVATPTGAQAQAGADTPKSQQPRKRMNQAQRRQMNTNQTIPLGSHSPMAQGPGVTRKPPVTRSNQANPRAGQQQPWTRQGAAPTAPVQPHVQPPPRHQYGQAMPADQGRMTQGAAISTRPPPSRQSLYHPRNERAGPGPLAQRQANYLEALARQEVRLAAMDRGDQERIEAFRAVLEEACRRAILAHEKARAATDSFDARTIELKSFGSLSSGFATKSSDMDLALLSPHSHPPPSSPLSPIPRILEKAFLDLGYGARLLTKTRVPIIKLCETPPTDLMDDLKAERDDWEKSIREEAAAAAAGAGAGAAATKTPDGKSDGKSDGVKEVVTVNGTTNPSSTDETLFTCSQGAQETLTTYFRRTRNWVEGRGGTDPSPGKAEQRRFMLAQVVRAWVDGLQDDTLRRRLQKVRSMDLEMYSRSLASVWSQAEGERIVLSWATRRLREATDDKERQGEMLVSQWRHLQDHVGSDVGNFERSLHRSWDRLKELPSANLGLLAEQKDETPKAYYLRTCSLLRALGGRDRDANRALLSPAETEVLQAVVEQYVQGLRDETRVHVRESLASRVGVRPALSEAYAQHHAECQVRRLSSGNRHRDMSEADRAVVEQYARFIRRDGASGMPAALAEEFQSAVRACQPPVPQLRERHGDHLEFPKSGVGIQSDVNFSNHLALHNTLLLRCYAQSDPRVRPMVLFVKAWAKRRQINSPYHGTLSSYGYVLMVLHFLVNIAQPPVAINLQQAWHALPPEAAQRRRHDEPTTEEGYDVRFWRDESAIQQLASQGRLTQNQQSVGLLLLGFFDYYARQGPHAFAHGFSWSMDVLSLRTPGGILSKQTKGWTGAKTTVTAPTQPGQRVKEVRHRYLFAIEDPFEIDHNIARTVTHNGIVAIRDEFRRAWQIIGRITGDTPIENSELFQDALAVGGSQGDGPGRGDAATRTAPPRTWEDHEVIGAMPA
ncbi:MAG: hypothetical protein M1838_001736 [Thelocarpon superellum]|nr:MAG: hypothetical protein M1838_001736 [Thelocarpon superellum]